MNYKVTVFIITFVVLAIIATGVYVRFVLRGVEPAEIETGSFRVERLYLPLSYEDVQVEIPSSWARDNGGHESNYLLFSGNGLSRTVMRLETSMYGVFLPSMLEAIYKNRALDSKMINALNSYIAKTDTSAGTIPLQDSFSYVESVDGAWRGYSYIRRYVTQSLIGYAPEFVFNLINGRSSQTLFLYGHVELDLASYRDLYSGWARDFDSFSDTWLKALERVNAQFAAGAFDLEMQLQLREAQHMISSLRIVSAEPTIYRSPVLSGGGFEVVLPAGWVYEEDPDRVAVVVFYFRGATAMEGIGSKVYLRETNAKTFEDFQKEIKARDADMSGIAYTIGAFGGFQTILAEGYPGIADEMEILYAFIGNGWYFEFVDPPFDLSSLKKL